MGLCFAKFRILTFRGPKGLSHRTIRDRVRVAGRICAIHGQSAWVPKGPGRTKNTMRSKFATHSEFTTRSDSLPLCECNTSLGFTGIFPLKEGFTA